MNGSRCAVCGERRLRRHLAVAGDAGDRGLIPTTDRYGVALADIARCESCGHMQLEPMPDEQALADAYAAAASDDYLREEAGQRATARRTLALIERHAPAGPRTLLDVGCWTGFLMDEARSRGWRAVGVEPSAYAAAHARERLGLEVIHAQLLEATLPAGEFGAVAMGDVIEHLPDPARALARIATALAPGGVLWLALPDADSLLARLLGRRWWSVIPTHVQYFTRDSIRLLLARCGWEVVALQSAPKTFTVGYYLGRLAGYAPALSRALVAAARAGGLQQRCWAPDFRDRIALVARRTSAAGDWRAPEGG